MQQWLYDEPHGYYATLKPIGKRGDFYTAVSTSKFFGGAIAKHIVDQIENQTLCKHVTICEIGAHQGYLLADIIEFIHTLAPELLQSLSFAVVERFEAMRTAQQNYFHEAFGDAITVQHFSDIHTCRFDEVFYISNEIFDAFPCELYYKGKVATVENHTITFNELDPTLDTLMREQHRQKGEIAVGYDAFALAIMQSAHRVHFMSFDYGEMEPRLDFSTRIYHQHKVFPLFEEGLAFKTLFQHSDITYDVNFSHVKKAFEQAGAKMTAYKTQMRALIDMGIMTLMQMLQEHGEQAIYEQEMQKVKKLILPEFLGERFKMIYFTTQRSEA